MLTAAEQMMPQAFSSMAGAAELLVSSVGAELVMFTLAALTYVLYSGQKHLIPPASQKKCVSSKLLEIEEDEEMPVEEEELDVLPEVVVKNEAAFSKEETSKTTAKDDAEEVVAEEVSIITKQQAIVHMVADKSSRTSSTLAPPPSLILEALAGGLFGMDSVVQVFLFVDLREVGRMATTCKAAKAGVWDDPSLWLALGGPHFAPAYQLLGGAGNLDPAGLREQFRAWVFGLDEANWSVSFAEKAHITHQADVFDDAAYLLGGLRSTDCTPVQMEAFGNVLCEQLALLDAGEETANTAAIRLLEKADRYGAELFEPEILRRMHREFEASTKHFQESLQRAKERERQEAREEEEERLRFIFDGGEGHGEQQEGRATTAASQESSSLAASFLNVLSGADRSRA